MPTTPEAPAVTVVLPYRAVFVQAHRQGCKAAFRKSQGWEPEVIFSTMTVEEIREMRANPDEGTVRAHSCLRPWLSEY